MTYDENSFEIRFQKNYRLLDFVLETINSQVSPDSTTYRLGRQDVTRFLAHLSLMAKQQLQQLLTQKFGHSQFRPGQYEIISSLIAGQDTLAVMPTGAGKSLCFQLAGVARGGLTVVITPLIALMQDQVRQLTQLGLSATWLNHTLTRDQRQEREEGLRTGKYQFLYLAPERLIQSAFSKFLAELEINLLIIDEAHGVDLWGYDFRPSYLHLSQFFSQLATQGRPRPPIGAFTATATTKSLLTISRALALHQPGLWRASPERPNVHLQVATCVNKHDRMLRLMALLNHFQGRRGLIYTLTREQAETIATFISVSFPHRPPLVAYHAGLTASQRAVRQQDFLTGKTPVMVCTNAFGLGIDLPNLAFVIHAQTPSSLENYWQEVGRAGRDQRQSAQAWLLYLPADFAISQSLIAESKPMARSAAWKRLKQMWRYCRTANCREKFILQYFDHQPSSHHRCGHCDCCRLLPFPWTSQSQQLFHRLQDKRQKFARTHDLQANTIVTNLSLHYLSLLDWRQPPTLSVIPGFGTGNSHILGENFWQDAIE